MTDIAAPDDPHDLDAEVLQRRLAEAACSLATARQNWTDATEHAAQVAREAAAAGMNEVRLARLLGVDRSRTLRRWLGKKRSAEQ